MYKFVHFDNVYFPSTGHKSSRNLAMQLVAPKFQERCARLSNYEIRKNPPPPHFCQLVLPFRVDSHIIILRKNRMFAQLGRAEYSMFHTRGNIVARNSFRKQYCTNSPETLLPVMVTNDIPQHHAISSFVVK